MSESKSRLARNLQIVLAANQDLQRDLVAVLRFLYVLAKREENEGRELAVSQFEADNIPELGQVRFYYDTETARIVAKTSLREPDEEMCARCGERPQRPGATDICGVCDAELNERAAPAPADDVQPELLQAQERARLQHISNVLEAATSAVLEARELPDEQAAKEGEDFEG